MFHVFSGDTYYAVGGLGDYTGVYDTFSEALRAAVGTRNDWWHIVSVRKDGSLYEMENSHRWLGPATSRKT